MRVRAAARPRTSRKALPARFAAIVLVAGAAFTAARAETLNAPFDFTRGAIGLDVTVKGAPLYVMLDTGVDPSAIDIDRARALGLKIDRGAGGEASGVGDTRSAVIYPATIDGLAILGRPFGSFDALASDLGGLSVSYGRRLDAVLGYSFLHDKAVLIDYQRRRVVIAGRALDAVGAARGCRTHWVAPMRFLADDNTPILPLRLGGAHGPGTLDTGSNGSVTLFPRALDLPGVRAALAEKGEVTHSGFRGDVKSKTYVLNRPVGFGPFALPAGQVVTLGKPASATDQRAANIGNRLFADLKLKILLDYPARRITFYGNCPAG